MSDSDKRFIISSAVLIFVLVAVVQGILGNFGYDGILWLWVNRTKEITFSLWVLLLIILLLGLVFAGLLYGYSRVSKTGKLQQIIKLDDELHAFINKRLHNPGEQIKKEALINLINSLLERTLAIISDAYRASVFLPDDEKPNHLTMQCRSGNMPEKTIKRTKFFIGAVNEGLIRGLAGQTFYECKYRVAHISKTNGGWQADRGEYIRFDEDASPSYRSVIAIPITLGKDTKCIGVMCLDSKKPKTFDSKQVEEILFSIARRMAIAIQVYENQDQ